MLKPLVALLMMAFFVGGATLIVRLVAPKWESRNLPGWVGPVVPLGVLASALAIIAIFG